MRWKLFWLLLLVLGIELGIRLLMRMVYGRHYQFAVYNYFLIDHPQYGFSFRKASSARSVPFPIFDKFIFRPGTRQQDALEGNHSRRVEFRVNSLGFRGPEFSLKKKNKDRVRIFASGGSTTAGIQVDDGEAWPAVLERELKNRGVNAEVINGGVPGWYSYQERLRFEREIVNYEPDIVLLHQGWNEEFVFSMQNLGKSWHPGLLMNAVEIGTMHSRAGRIFSRTGSLLFRMLVMGYFWDWRFKKTMSCLNPSRWHALRASDYIEHWFGNIMSMAKLASQMGIKLYTINPPCLSDIQDAPADREFYEKHTGLNGFFLDYQAISKKRIQKVILEAGRIVPFIDAEMGLQNLRGPERLGLFYDEIHHSPKGHGYLARLIAENLVAADGFARSGSNVIYDDELVQKIREGIGNNYNYIDDLLEKKIQYLRSTTQKDGHLLELPMQRYTTF